MYCAHVIILNKLLWFRLVFSSHYSAHNLHFEMEASNWVEAALLLLLEGARWSSGIEAAIGARSRGSRPVHYLTVQRPWTSR